MPAMIELMRTNDAVLISYVEALLRDSDIGHFVADQNMSILDGSIGILPRRIMVDGQEEERARQLMRDAGLGDHLK
jgi:Putative prokaryotic signal transducing protein